jgi:LAO/AO transport system kinase
LVDGLIRGFRKDGRTVGVVAVDPTSPFTGGALLGDRIRMQSQWSDPEVFIRSMASRGSWGGLAVATTDVIELLDAFGKDVVIAETVGVGQSEFDVVDATQSTVVVVVPESGDSIQVMKAGLMEIADVFVINKADRDGAGQMETGLAAMLDMRDQTDPWRPSVLQTVATSGEGIRALIDALEEHHDYLVRENLLSEWERKAIRARILSLVHESLREGFWIEGRKELLERQVEDVLARKVTPGGAARELLVSPQS